jgi:hypothetical protein
MYVDSATVAFTASGSFVAGQSELVMAELMARSMMSIQSQSEVRKVGGTATYNVALVNLNNENFPNYSVPYVNLTVFSRDPAEAGRTFSIVSQKLVNDLAARQSQAGAAPKYRITATFYGQSGVAVPQSGYPKRTFAGLALLCIIVTFLVTIFLDRHPSAIPAFLRSRRRESHNTIRRTLPSNPSK